MALPVLVLGLSLVRDAQGPDIPKLKMPEGVGPTAPPTSLVDYSTVVLPTVAGTTTVPKPPTTGAAHLKGIVLGPFGVVGGAIVRVERLTETSTTRIDVFSGADGLWDLPNIP